MNRKIKLFPMPLLGQGTAEVESLPSYLSRCAYEHGVSVGVFVGWVRDFGVAEVMGFPKGYRAVQNIETLARCNQYSYGLRSALETLTGQDLRCRPLEFLDQSVYRISTEITGFRWCPECLSEMCKRDEPLYIKQIWHMKAISHCPIHRTPLLSFCQFCESEQIRFSPEFPVGYCINCSRSIASRKHPISPAQIESSWKSYSYDIVDLFEQTAKTVPNVDLEKQRHFFWNLRVRSYYEFVYKKEWADVVRSYLRKWPTGKRLISQRRFAYLFNMTLFQFMSVGETGLSLPLLNEVNEEIPEHLEKVGRVYRDHMAVKARLEEIAFSHDPPVSLKMLARAGEVSVGYVEYRFPDLAKRVVEKYQNHKLQQKLTKRYHAQVAALKFFTENRYSTHSQSRKEAYRVLREETGLPKWVLKNAIQVAYRALN